MLTATLSRDEGLVDIRFRDLPGPIYGAELTYSLDGGEFRPCAIYPGKDMDALLAATFWTWNQAVEFGRVKFDGRMKPVYWNLYLNGLHAHQGTVVLRADVLLERGVTRCEVTLELQPSRAVYLDIAEAWAAMLQDLALRDPAVGAGEKMVALRVPADVSGRYAVSVGLRGGLFSGMLKIDGEPCRYPFVLSAKHPELEDKCSKEIPWKTAELAEGACIEISLVPAAARDPKVLKPGGIAYLKLVPAPAAPASTRKDDRTLALYFEPYSWAHTYGLTKPAQVREAMALYKEMGGTEVHNQPIRFGSRALHHSRVAERFEAGQLMADDGTFTNNPANMVRAMDVLRETIDACHELGLTHYANAALSNCYPGTDFEERISREHPEWVTGNILRYNRPETRAFAAAVMAEFVEWGSDGVSVDCMRYPDFHTEEDLVLLFREVRRAVDAAAKGQQVPLAVRLPASDPVYYRAFETLVQEGAVQCVAPSTVWPREPYVSVRPYLKWKDYGCRVLGVVDGWKTWVGTFCDSFQLELLLSPADIRADIRRHLRDGADGIFVYQADGHCADPFNWTALNWK
ncbi:MAG: hypothetical protein ACYDCO_09310 [Armatimonadota bacterium]